jgi:hypothetical protein
MLAKPMVDRLFQLDKATIQIAKKSQSDIIKAYGLAAEAGKAIVNSIKEEEVLARNFAAGKVIFIKQIMDKQVELANLVAQQERDMWRVNEYDVNIENLESAITSKPSVAVRREIEHEASGEEDNLKTLRTGLLSRSKTVKALAEQIVKMEEQILAIIPKQMYKTFKKIIAEGELTEKEIQKMFDEIRVESSDIQQLEKFIASERSAT